MAGPPLPQRFSVTEQVSGDGTTTVAVGGELDLATAPQLSDVLESLAAREAPTVLDLSDVSFLDSTGLKVVLAAGRTSERTGWSFVVGRAVGPAVARLFEMVDAAALLPFADA
jgi:anti-sigma B factor antagonist